MEMFSVILNYTYTKYYFYKITSNMKTIFIVTNRKFGNYSQ